MGVCPLGLLLLLLQISIDHLSHSSKPFFGLQWALHYLRGFLLYNVQLYDSGDNDNDFSNSELHGLLSDRLGKGERIGEARGWSKQKGSFSLEKSSVSERTLLTVNE